MRGHGCGVMRVRERAVEQNMTSACSRGPTKHMGGSDLGLAGRDIEPSCGFPTGWSYAVSPQAEGGVAILYKGMGPICRVENDGKD